MKQFFLHQSNDESMQTKFNAEGCYLIYQTNKQFDTFNKQRQRITTRDKFCCFHF